jgi:hypothetical protein
LKKQSPSQRSLDVKAGYLVRNSRQNHQSVEPDAVRKPDGISKDKRYFRKNKKLLKVDIDSRNRVEIHLPSKMNFSTEHESTIAHLMAIRRLVKRASYGSTKLRLKRVAFEELKEISTSAALVLTAELVKWEDASKIKLKPNVEKWNSNVFRQFSELGFFDLFERAPEMEILASDELSGRRLVSYIKGTFQEHSKPRMLEQRLRKIVGNEIDEWEFLHTGITEAIINVTHHAYPEERNYTDIDKNWYLTGSYDEYSRQLKIVFYDQGVTIPSSLPASDWGEKILQFLSSNKILEGKNDSHLIRAAMEMSRSRTNEEDRGKGLQDILEFVKQRNNGYLAVVSKRGIFRLDVNGASEDTSTHGLRSPLEGTLIVWRVTLEDSGV